MRKRHMEHMDPMGYMPPMHHYPRKKKRAGTVFIIVVIAVVLLYFYFSGSGSFKINLPNFSSPGNQTASANSNVQKCINNVNKCGGVINSKYDATVTVLQSNETNSSSEANQFLKTWGPSSKSQDIGSYNAGFPVILVATRFNNPDSSRTPHVFVCTSNGSLTEASISGLC